MGSGMIGSSLSGLQAAQLGLQTTEHNIANVNTAGFSRQQTVQVDNPGVLSGSGFIGRGTQVTTIERLYSRFLTDQVNRSQSGVSELESYYAQIQQVDSMVSDTTTGLSSVLQEFFKNVQAVSANPSQVSTRQAMISGAQALSARYRSLGDQLAQIGDGLNNEIKASVTEINSYAGQIAALNQRIVVDQAGSGHTANDLLDTRDQMVLGLNKLIKTNTTSNKDGSINVFVGSGQQLVVSSQAMSMTTTPSAADPSRLAIGLKTASGTQEMPEALITGGSLSGLLKFRRESLDVVSNELGRNAASLALTFNAQSALGQDLLGQSQLSAAPNSFSPNVFVISQPKVIANTGNPASSPTVSATFVNPPPYNGNYYTDLGSSDYRLSFDGSNTILTRLSDNKQWSGAGLAQINNQLLSDPQGFTLTASGALAAGSSYLIQPTRDVARNFSVNAAVAADPRLIAAAGPIRAAAGQANTGSATITGVSVGPGYAAAASSLPISLTYQSGQLSHFPVGAQVSVNGGAPVAITASTDTIAFSSGATLTLVGSVAGTPPVGVSFSISGVPNNGDTFSLTRNVGATADGGNALLLAQLQTQDTMSGKTDSFLDAYAQVVSATGSKTHQAQVTSEAQQTLLDQAQASRDSFAGVNLDEEAANLIRYQQAYQASAKALQIGASLFDTILQVANA